MLLHAQLVPKDHIDTDAVPSTTTTFRPTKLGATYQAQNLSGFKKILALIFMCSGLATETSQQGHVGLGFEKPLLFGHLVPMRNLSRVDGIHMSCVRCVRKHETRKKSPAGKRCVILAGNLRNVIGRSHGQSPQTITDLFLGLEERKARPSSRAEK